MNGGTTWTFDNVGATTANSLPPFYQNNPMRLNAFANPGQATLGTNFTISRADGTAEQRFRYDKVAAFQYRLTVLSNNKGYCLDIYGNASNVRNVSLIQNPNIRFTTHVYNPSSSGTNIWFIDEVDSVRGHVVIRSTLNPSLVLTADGTGHRSSVSVKRYTGSDLQKWRATRV
jgi:hypothetical protein